MKLISMTDFVLQNQGKVLNSELGVLACNYAKFLKQPLKLEMFVTCDENGNVLENPFKEGGRPARGVFDKYKKAKEKVLFEGFTYNSEIESVERIEDGSLWGIDVDDLVKYTIEDMIQCELKLTQISTKQFL